MEQKYEINVIKELLLTNQELNNTQIAKLYNEKLNTDFNPDRLRKIVKKVRKSSFCKFSNSFYQRLCACHAF